MYLVNETKYEKNFENISKYEIRYRQASGYDKDRFTQVTLNIIGR